MDTAQGWGITRAALLGHHPTCEGGSRKAGVAVVVAGCGVGGLGPELFTNR